MRCMLAKSSISSPGLGYSTIFLSVSSRGLANLTLLGESLKRGFRDCIYSEFAIGEGSLGFYLTLCHLTLLGVLVRSSVFTVKN